MQNHLQSFLEEVYRNYPSFYNHGGEILADVENSYYCITDRTTGLQIDWNGQNWGLARVSGIKGYGSTICDAAEDEMNRRHTGDFQA